MSNMFEIFSLKGKKAIVTGASSGLGKDMAITLAAAGAEVALLSRNTEELKNVTENIKKDGGKAITCKMDITNIDNINSAIDQVFNKMGKVDILINNAGIEGNKELLDITPEYLENILNVNLKGHIYCSQKVGRRMINKKYGKIINISSIMGLIGLSKGIPYSITKAGILGFTKSLALEWAKYNIQVNAICPGYILTKINENYFASEAGKKMIKKIPMRRYGVPSELRGACLLLASDASSFITGSILVVDGGQIV